MKKKTVWLPMIGLLLAAAAIFCRPVTIESLCPGLELEESEALICSYALGDGEEIKLEFLPGSEGYDKLIELFEGLKFHRSPVRFLPSPGGGDFRWNVDFKYTQTTLKDGSSWAGSIVMTGSDRGRLVIFCAGEQWLCYARDQKRWQADVMEVLWSGEVSAEK